MARSKKSTPIKNAIKNTKAIVTGVKKVAKAASKKPAPSNSQPKINKQKKSYSIRELSPRKNATLNQYITELDKNADELDKLKKPGEFWAFTIANNKSHQLFASMSLLAAKLNQYKQIAAMGGGRGKKAQNFIDAIKVVRFNAGIDTTKAKTEKQEERDYRKIVDTYQTGRKKERSKKEKEYKRMDTKATKVVEKITGTKPKTKFDLFKGLVETAESLQNVNAKLEKQLKDMQKRMSKLEKATKPAKKSPAKKSPAKKSPAKKSPAKKSTSKKSPAKKGNKRK